MDTSGQEKEGTTYNDVAVLHGKRPQYQGTEFRHPPPPWAAEDRARWRTLAVASLARRRRQDFWVSLFIIFRFFASTYSWILSTFTSNWFKRFYKLWKYWNHLMFTSWVKKCCFIVNAFLLQKWLITVWSCLSNVRFIWHRCVSMSVRIVTLTD